MKRADSSSRQQRLERALAGSHDGYWERDLHSGESWYSPSFYALFGLTPEALPGRRGMATARVHPDDRAHFIAAYEQALRELTRFSYEVRFLDGAGAWRWVRGRGQVWPGDDGRARYICGAASDVHREKTALLALEDQRAQLEALVAERTAGLQAARQLAEQRRDEAEAANAAKSVFLAQMSHEIRTPLNGVLGLTELALRMAQSPAQRRYLETSLKSGQALLRVISDVLDFSRIEAGGVELQARPLDLPQLLADALRGVMPLVTGRPLALLYDWTGDDEQAVGDERCIRQIINNLVGNAIKFTAEGLIIVSGDAQRRPDGQLQIRIRIEDSGPGIAAAQRERVFEAFVQGDERLSRTHGGTGLGLAIARRLARAMGGDLVLDAQHAPGAALQLSLTLPAAAAVQPLQAAALPPRHVWLVYPHAGAAQWTERRFQRLGSSIESLPSLAEAITTAQRLAAPGRSAPPHRRPDLVLIAEQALSPESSLASLREALPQAALHLAIRPDWYQPALEAQARALGIVNTMLPFTPRTLRAMLAGAASAGQALLPAPPLRQGASVLLVEDNPVNQLVGSEFLRALGLQVNIANEGTEALAACQAQPPDLVLMDLQMPGMDGLEATRRLRDMQRQALWPGAPIVALTAHAGASDRQACEAVGMDAVLTKPLTMDTLQRELARWLAA
ncbi:PAS domain-containing hybrid sensor histidine kinase/response regulator [Aquabacterium sp.]|uniref:PAS domain-containing hybrid sensor histidine kinase/response regulator n=1 Tax=Aquabacterium sp. TaxID=1872578 RepID=UPI002D0C9C98|nr:response regulator [Aquabacterium sp.]HSW08651.1 response regulator [Aquabacterium sp.]